MPEYKAGNKNYKLNSFLNFIDVEDKHQTIPNGSSCNSAEVEVVESLMKQLKANGKPASSIAVLTGYLWQLENLQKAAKMNGCSNFGILYVETSQGVDSQTNITVNPEVCLGHDQLERSILQVRWKETTLAQ